MSIERVTFSWADVLNAIKSETCDVETVTRLRGRINAHVSALEASGGKRYDTALAIQAKFNEVYPTGKRGRKAGAADAELDAVDLSELGIE